MSDQLTEEFEIEDLFDLVLEDYELDISMTFEDILFEMFSYGFEAGVGVMSEESYEEAEEAS